ncbi:uncharacterized protein BXZ73DRAFT_87662 [Epithele typhae]|uniref:uncharacterized protein n=1 Tax=Epithele typhae TaxID=378194 RepID=UPI002008E9C6|nr:uncharacterized protein BXZ73DRAFT_87662 [Epithele typhae]KAH9943311.1 hypothetical protein BXZ73DRAFT_87662 [Epithele typhae]
MADLYTSLHVSPKKKRTLPSSDDEDVLTPKRLRRNSTVPPTPSTSRRKQTNTAEAGPDTLPEHLARLHKIQTSLQQALSHALATCAVAPSEDTGIVRNVLNHLSLGAYSGFATHITLDDLKRLCWLWEWDGASAKPESNTDAGEGKGKGKGKAEDAVAVDDEDENPFLEDAKPVEDAKPKEWMRGGMGFVVSQTTHHVKSAATRVSVYGFGIEVEMDIDKDMKGGMAAVARWTADSETRRKELFVKLQKWSKLHSKEPAIPRVPMADLPTLPSAARPSNLTRLLASASPKSPSSSTILAAPQPPGSPTRASRSPSKSPTKTLRDFAVPFPVTPSSRLTTPHGTPTTDRIFKTPTTNRIFKTPSTNRILFPKTPSSRHSTTSEASDPRTPTASKTPSLSGRETPTASDDSVPSTPTHQRGPDAVAVPQTPTSSRRQALYERVRQRSLQNTPTKADPTGASMSKDQLLRLSQEEMRRRCLLGRLSGVADSVWMFFSNPMSSASVKPGTRKRRAMPVSEVATAVVKSSPVPLSLAEARESLEMLVKLCPFFIRQMDVGGEEWLEMPATSTDADGDDDKDVAAPVVPAVPSSPGKLKARDESAVEVHTRSPRRVKKEYGGLREVRERIRKELESVD